MNDKLQYASMLEIPVKSCNITYKPSKKRGKKKTSNGDEVKEELLNKINAEETQPQETDMPLVSTGYINEGQDEEFHQQPSIQEEDEKFFSKKPNRRFKFKITTIGVQLMVIGALILTILITNSVHPNSGLNVFMRGIFSSDQAEEVADTREYSEFAPVFATDANVSVSEGGVMTITGAGSVYSTVNGKVTSVTQEEDGTYSMEIAHSEKFLSVISGLDRVYVSEGDTVFNTIPVGYVDDAVDMCFKGEDGAVISDYQIIDGSVVWAV